MKGKTSKLMALVLALLLVAGLATVSLAGTGGTGQGVVQQGMMQCRQGAQTALKALSDLTGLGTDEIRAERQQGKSLVSIAESKGITEQQLTDKVVAERKAALDQLKADGKITDAQYQACLSNMEERIQSNLERTTIGPNGQGKGQGAGMGGCQGNGQGRGCGMQGRGQQSCINYTAAK